MGFAAKMVSVTTSPGPSEIPGWFMSNHGALRRSQTSSPQWTIRAALSPRQSGPSS
jgi:hypothetical protein